MNIGLFFGSFNPIHVGHLIIAEYMTTMVDEVWIVLSPQNPFKKNQDLLDQEKRLRLINLSIENHPKIKVSTVEFDLPKPSFTVNTLKHLHEVFQEHKFNIIMGEDNIQNIRKWRESEYILSHPIYVYPRKGYTMNELEKAELGDQVIFTEAPIMDISSTHIRKKIGSEESNIQFMLRNKTWEEIKKEGWYSISK